MEKIISCLVILLTVANVRSEEIPKEKYSIKNNLSKLSDSISYSDFKSEQQPTIYINQSSNIHILAKFGQTVNLPCMIYKLKNQDLSQIHAIWHKLTDRQRPVVLSIGAQQLKQDLRYRVKQVTLDTNNEPSEATETSDYIIENWQFEIRKLTFEDAGTYQCLLPLVKPITRNITLKIQPEIIVEPKEGNFFANQKILINCKANVKINHNNHNKNQRHQKPVLNWYKENELVRNLYNPNTKHKIEIQNSHNNENHSLNSMLIIYNAREEDSGNYVCSYENHKVETTVLVLNEEESRNNFLISGLNNAKILESNKIFCILTAFILLIML